MTHLLLVDGTNIVHRSYWATAHAGLSSDGVATGGLYGSINALRSYMREIKPSHSIWCFDKGKSEFRTALRPEYKGHRKYAAVKTVPTADPSRDIPEQTETFRNFLTSCGIRHVSQQGVEADDLIATAVKRWRTIDTTIVSSDHDLLQLVGEHVRVFRPGEKRTAGATGIRALANRGGMAGKYYGDLDVVEKYGVRPHQLPEVWALTGDTGDNIAGIPKVGPKTAAKWINQYGNLALVLRYEEKTRGFERQVAENYELILLNGRIGRLPGELFHYTVEPPDDWAILRDLEKWKMSSLVESVKKEGMW